MVTANYGADRAVVLRDSHSTETAAPASESKGGAAEDATEKSKLPLSLLVKISVGGVSVVTIILFAIFPSLFLGSSRSSSEELIEASDPFKEARSGDPAEQYGTFGRYFCRGGQQSWFCQGDEAEE